MFDKVLEAEATYSNWGLFNRFVLASQLLDAADAGVALTFCRLGMGSPMLLRVSVS